MSLIVIVFVLLTLASQVHSQPQVTLSSGATVTGVVTPLGVHAYSRFHYASQPHRLQPSTMATTNNGQNIKATSTAYPQPVCPQVIAPGYSYVYSPTEDCLLVTVLTPANATSTSNLTVMVFIHGGALVTGTGFVYDGSNFVIEHNVIYVTFNYRLGFLGFGGLPGLNGDSSVGNYGFLDQVVLLQWVQANIASFGGSKDKVTIFGESAGATSVCFHLASPLSRGLFRSAIVESSNCETVWSVDETTSLTSSLLSTVASSSCSPHLLAAITNATANATTTNSSSTSPAAAAAAVAAALLTCVSALPLTALVPASLTYAAGTVDGVYVTDTFSNMIKVGKGSNVPVIAYVNLNETAYQYCSDIYTSIQSGQLVGAWSYFLDGNSSAASQIVKYYQSTFPSQAPFQTLVQSTTDAFFRCSTRSVLDSLITANSLGLFTSSSTTATTTRPPLYMFSFEYAAGFSGPCRGSFHSVDLFFLFPNLDATLSPYTMSAAEIQLGAEMRAMWAQFAKTADPTTPTIQVTDYCVSASANAGNVSEWNATQNVSTSSACSHAYLRIASASNVKMVPTAYFDETCAFWEKSGSAQQVNGGRLLAQQTAIPGTVKAYVSSFTGSGCAGNPAFASSVTTGACINGAGANFIASCSSSSASSSWSLSFFTDTSCTTPTSAPASTGVMGEDVNACGVAVYPGIGVISAEVNCLNAAPLIGTLAVYTGLSALNCLSSSASASALVSYSAVRSGQCFPLTLSDGSAYSASVSAPAGAALSTGSVTTSTPTVVSLYVGAGCMSAAKVNATTTTGEEQCQTVTLSGQQTVAFKVDWSTNGTLPTASTAPTPSPSPSTPASTTAQPTSAGASCPPSFPYLCTHNFNNGICFNSAAAAAQCSGAINSWCALSSAASLPQISGFIQAGYGITCQQAVTASCPRSFPFLCTGRWSSSVCFNTGDSATACEGPVNSWCALTSSSTPSDIAQFVAQGYGINCNAPAVGLCPPAFPFLCTAAFNSTVCYETAQQATMCDGPIGSWCGISSNSNGMMISPPSVISGFIADGYGSYCQSTSTVTPTSTR